MPRFRSVAWLLLTLLVSCTPGPQPAPPTPAPSTPGSIAPSTVAPMSPSDSPTPSPSVSASGSASATASESTIAPQSQETYLTGLFEQQGYLCTPWVQGPTAKVSKCGTVGNTDPVAWLTTAEGRLTYLSLTTPRSNDRERVRTLWQHLQAALFPNDTDLLAKPVVSATTGSWGTFRGDATAAEGPSMEAMSREYAPALASNSFPMATARFSRAFDQLMPGCKSDGCPLEGTKVRWTNQGGQVTGLSLEATAPGDAERVSQWSTAVKQLGQILPPNGVGQISDWLNVRQPSVTFVKGLRVWIDGPTLRIATTEWLPALYERSTAPGIAESAEAFAHAFANPIADPGAWQRRLTPLVTPAMAAELPQLELTGITGEPTVVAPTDKDSGRRPQATIVAGQRQFTVQFVRVNDRWVVDAMFPPTKPA